VVSVHPNPCAEQVSVTLHTAGNARFALFDLSGRTLSTTPFQGRLSLDVSTLAQGVYLYRIALADGRTVQGKIQKDRSR
jgi:hypothetical protein